MTKQDTLSIEAKMRGQRVRRSMDRVQRVPALSNVVTKIIALADNPTVSGQQVAEIVGKDQSMVTAILKIVNSPFYGLNRRVSSISHAIVLLGYRTIRNVALSTTLLNTFGKKKKEGFFDRTRCWRHAIATAACAKVLAEHVGDTDAEEAFLAGLIHDMGSIILDHYFSDEFEEALELAMKESIPLLEAEARTFGMTHADVGKLVAEKWNFPAEVCAAIGTHHDFEAARQLGGLPILVYVANLLSEVALERASITEGSDGEDDGADETSFAAGGSASREGDGAGAVAAWERVKPEVLACLGLEKDNMEGLMADLEGEMERARAFLSSMSG